MRPNTESPYAALKRVFHEPSRMALMAALCSSEDGASFNDLKAECALTDGNLSRHIKALEEAGAVCVTKYAYGAKARTMISLTDSGREQFVDYLKTLEEILRLTTESMATEETFAPLLNMGHIAP